MAASISPTVIKANKGDPLTPAQFSKEVDKYGEYAKHLFYLQAELYRSPDRKLNIKGHVVDRKKLNSFFKAWLHQRNCFKKFYANRKKKTSRNNSQLSALFPVSDQMVALFTKGNLGPLNPWDEDDGEQLVDHISLLTENHLATGGIMTSLFSQYVNRNNLKNDSVKGRFQPDKHLMKSLSTTNYSLFGNDLSSREIAPGTPPDKVKKIKDHNKNGKKSVFKLLEGKKSNKGKGDIIWDEDTGLLFLSMMIIYNFYRIPKALLDEDEIKTLTDKKNIEASKDLQAQLTKITDYYNSQKKK